MSDRDNGRRLLLLLAAVLALLTASDVVNLLRITNNHDFAVYLEAAQRLRNGQDIYAELESFRAQIEQGVSTQNEDTPWPFSTPPLLAALLVPLTFLPQGVGGYFWTLLCLLAIVLSAWLVLRSQSWLSLAGLLIALLLLYQYQPAVVGLRLGQVDVIIFLLLTLAFALLKDGRQTAAGLVLALAIGLKFFAGFLALFLLWKRQWRPALLALAGGGLLVLGSFTLTGMAQMGRYVSFSSLYTTGAFAAYPYHQSFNAFFARHLKANMFTPPLADAPALALALTALASALALGGLLWLTRQPLAARHERFDVEFGLALCTMLLVAPPSPRYAFIWLIPVFVIALARQLRGAGPAWLLGVTALAYLLVGRLIYVPVPLLRRLADGQFMVGTIVLWLALAVLLVKTAPDKGVAR